MTGLHDIEVAVDPGGATVVVDGAPIGPVAAVTIQAAQGQVPQVLVQLATRGSIRVEGTIDIEAALSPGDLVRSLDPDRLRQADIDSLPNRSLATDPYATTLTVVADLLDQITGADQ